MHKPTEIVPFFVITYTDPSQRDGKGHIIGEFYLMYVNTSKLVSAKIKKRKTLRETLGWWNWKDVKDKQVRIWDSKGRVPKTMAKSGEKLPSFSLELSISTLTAFPKVLCTGHKGYRWLSTVWKQPKAAPPISALCARMICAVLICTPCATLFVLQYQCNHLFGFL